METEKAKEFFRAEYLECIDNDGDKCVIPTVWIGNQGFDLKEQYKQNGESAKKHAEWFVSMFKKAIDNYADQENKALLEQNESQNNVLGLMTESLEQATEELKKEKEQNRRYREALTLLNTRIDNYWNNGRTDAQAKYICQSQIECGKILKEIEQ